MKHEDLMLKLHRLPGLFHMRDMIQKEITEIESLLNGSRDEIRPLEEPLEIKALREINGTEKSSKKKRNFWDDLTPRQRTMRINRMNQARLDNLKRNKR